MPDASLWCRNCSMNSRTVIEEPTAPPSDLSPKISASCAFSAPFLVLAPTVRKVRAVSPVAGSTWGEGHLPLVGVVAPAQPSAGVPEALHLRGLLPGLGFLSGLLSGTANETRPAKRKRVARPRRSKGASGKPRKAGPQARFPRPRSTDIVTDNPTDI